jgi:hypothetical protein
MALALTFWLTRVQISARLGAHFRWISATLGVAIVVWVYMRFRVIGSGASPPSGDALLGAVQIQNLFALKIPAVLVGALIWWGIQASRSAWVPALLSMLLLGLAIGTFPVAFKQARTLAATADIREFADWENVIPPTSTVLVSPPRDAGAFVWFTLGRPNYLALNQSSGVVFSRETSLEVRRRSEVLLPLLDPEWKILTRLRSQSAGDRKSRATTRPITAKNLAQVCEDPQLGFVVSSEQVGFGPLRHLRNGAWKDWNLYDCRKVRLRPSAT